MRHSNHVASSFAPVPHQKCLYHILWIFLGCNSDVQPGVHVQDARAAGQGAGGWKGGGTWEDQIESRKVLCLLFIHFFPAPVLEIISDNSQ